MRRAGLLGIVVLLALVAVACGRSASSLNEEANRLYEQGDYTAALELYQRAQAERPDRLELYYNASNALHRLGRYDRAAEEARRALFADDPQLLAKANYSLGNHLFRQGELRSALDAYKNALIHDPTDADAKFNLEVVLARLTPPLPSTSQPPGAGDDRPPSEETPPEGSPGGPPNQGEPGQGEPGQEQPGDGTGNEGPPQPGDRGEGFANEEEYQRTLAEALAGIDQEFTIEEALRVLEVLAQRLQDSSYAPAPQANPSYRDW